ncbi:hypothetical protein ACE6H2_007494 [Prunus campanulata]
MASHNAFTIALLLSLNFVFFTSVSSNHHVPNCPPPPKSPKPKHPPHPTPKQPSPTPTPTPKQPPPSTPSPSPPKASCPKDTLKLGVCGNLLNDLVHLVVGTPSKTPCCSLIAGLADVDAAVCLCTAIKANVLGINLNVPVSLSLLLNYCGKSVPTDFQCA